MNTADLIIAKLGMQPHVEGGYFIETYKNSLEITSENTGINFEGKRSLASTIFYLLKSGQVSKFHKLKFDEQWFFHSGSSLLIHLIDKNGELKSVVLGAEISNNQQPRILVEAGVVLGAEIRKPDTYCLVSCVVSPGFDYRDFVLFESDTLIEQFPQHEKIIRKFNG